MEQRASEVAGFWRRIAALSIDSIALGTFGICLGFLCFDRLAALGSLGRFIGGAIALAYFGILNSRIGRGQTLGKRVLGIRVVDANATTIGLSRSTLRAFVLLLPITLNGVYLPIMESTPLVTGAVSLCVFGLGGALIYLFLFNRRTRQSIHDLAARTFVVGARDVCAVRERIWKPHLALISGWLLVLAVGMGPLSDLLLHAAPYQGVVEVQHAAGSVAPGAQVSVVRGTKMAATLSGGRSSSTFVEIRVVTPVEPESYEGLADRIAEAALRAHRDTGSVAQVTISISYGYDIMISSMHRTQTFSHSPQEWDERPGVDSRTDSAA